LKQKGVFQHPFIFYRYMRFIIFALRILTGFLFLFSGLSKLFPLEPFEFSLIHYQVVGFSSAPFIARLIVGLEFAIAGVLFMNFKPKTMFNLVLVFMIILTGFLFYLLIKYGTQADCLCFGSRFDLPILPSIGKNIFILGILILLIRFNDNIKVYCNQYIIFGIIILLLVLPFLLYPVKVSQIREIPANFKNLAQSNLFKQAKDQLKNHCCPE